MGRIKYNDIEDAFMFVSMSPMFSHTACICRKTGKTYYRSEEADMDDLPEDVYENEDYVEIPHKNELDLGKKLVLDFSSVHLPHRIDKVHSIFSTRGAYQRFKDLLEYEGLLDEWYSFEKKKQKKALIEWCHDNHIDIED